MKREITERDLYPTLFEDQSDHIGDHLEVLWGDHVDECKEKNQKPSLLKMVTKTFHKKFLFFGLFSLAEEAIFRIIQVIALGYVLDYFEGNYLTTLTGTVLFGVGNNLFINSCISCYPKDIIHAKIDVLRINFKVESCLVRFRFYFLSIGPFLIFTTLVPTFVSVCQV